MASVARMESNRWLSAHTASIQGRVLSIGSMDDRDGEGRRYREYFTGATSYTTSEHIPYPGCELVIDVRTMPQVADASFDCVFCSGVLEHVDDYDAGMREITRILKPGGVLLLGLPFRQGLHLVPTDYWRFTEFGIRTLLQRNGYHIDEIAPIDASVADFPASYWSRATKPQS
jgi:SAM-dependent methyltransferase